MLNAHLKLIDLEDQKMTYKNATSHTITPYSNMAFFPQNGHFIPNGFSEAMWGYFLNKSVKCIQTTAFI